MTAPVSPPTSSADSLIEPAITLVTQWLQRSSELETADDRETMEQLGDLIADDRGVSFVMGFVDRVVRPDSNAVGARQLTALVSSGKLPGFLSRIDAALLTAGARIAPLLPDIVLPLARRRMKTIVGHLVAPGEPTKLAKHLETNRADGFALNVNLLGEAVMGEREATTRLERLLRLLEQPHVDYVSVKISAVASQLNHWAYDDSLLRVKERAALLFDHAASVSPPTFINFDMEEYHDLELTMQAFKEVLSEPERLHLDAGIVLQAYLPDSFAALQDLVTWANQRHIEGGGNIKIRLVKGANLAMEKVDAAMHGWEQAPYGTKIESDANYKRCLEWAFTPERLTGVRIGVASHNLFDVAWAKLLADEQGVAHRVQFEMLQGMASAQAKAVNESTAGNGSPQMLLYTPAVEASDFDVAISYLFRRLEENAADDNFMKALFSLTPGSASFAEQESIFREAMAMRHNVAAAPNRTQNRFDGAAVAQPGSFKNDPETDPSLPANRKWIEATLARQSSECFEPLTTTIDDIDGFLGAARRGFDLWSAMPAEQRRLVLHQAANELDARRSELIAAMLHEANKTFEQADNEICEAIDFARWYADAATELTAPNATFKPLGVVAVVPPWNFPVAIPAGGVLASLAAGNSVIFKPAPETPRCAEIVAEALWTAGVPGQVLQFRRTPDNEVGRHLIESVDGVILTGSSETADLFRSWKPNLKLFAETSGKNVLIITPNADIDLAAKDLVQSAFGHAGQKCSAASLAILVGEVADSDRFHRQVIDAVESLTLGASTDIRTDIAPMVGGINDRLRRAVTTLDTGESWLVEPTISGDTCSPGVRSGVTPNSWFHRTECFGPILGLMHAETLDDAIAIANSSHYALTGGIHSLDPAETDHWMEHIEVGNGYVNRAITGAIVARQPFGGWKHSSVGPGAKAGGPNYVMSLGTWTPTAEAATDDFQEIYDQHFAKTHDPVGLFCEANLFRYRPLDRIIVRIGPGGTDDADTDLKLVEKAAAICGVPVLMSRADVQDDDEFCAVLRSLTNDGQSTPLIRVRLLGTTSDQVRKVAAGGAIHIADQPVTRCGRIELQNYLREQAVSITLHRFGNLVGLPTSVAND